MIEAERNVVAKQEAQAAKPEADEGAVMLRRAANCVLQEQGVEIATALGNSSKEGKIPAIKLLYELAMGHQEPENAEEAGQFRSLADELAADPPWPGQRCEEDAETTAGRRNLEG